MLTAAFLARMAREIEQVAYFKIESAGASAKLRELVERGGPAVEGLVFTTHGYPEAGTPMADFWARYKEKYGAEVFLFDGKSHRVTNCVIHHQDKDIVIRGEGVTVEQSGNVWRKE